MYKFSDGECVYYDNGTNKGWVIVRGVAMVEQPDIGVGYIVKPENPEEFNLPNASYQFEMFTAFECHLQVV
jgi:hypothetical protein